MRLEFHGIHGPKPVALVEERFGFLRGRAWFISTYIEGSDATGLDTESATEAVVNSIADTLLSLSEAGVTHGDLKASNLLLDGEGRAVIVDLDSMTEHRTEGARLQAISRDRERFLRNFSSEPALVARFEALLTPSRATGD